MAKIILDKNLQTEVIIDVNNLHERVIDNKLNGLKSIHVEEGSVLPVIPTVPSTFTTLNITTDDGIELPLSCSYNKVDNFVTQYFEEDKLFSYNIDLTYEA